jgi:arylsulfatase
VNREPAHIIDLLPTFVDLSGTKSPKEFSGREIMPLDGRSMVSLLRGEKRRSPPYYTWFWGGKRAYRKGDRKLVWDNRIKKWELYDLATDRCETIDLSNKYPDEVTKLSEA